MEQLPLQIVLLHGITGSRRFFSGLENRLQSAPIFADAFSLDLLGFGDNKDVQSELTANDQLGWIDDSISRRFPSGKIVVIGHSLGGVLALCWAADHLPRVAKLVLLNTPLGESRDDIVRSLLADHLDWATLLLKYKMFAHLACVVMRGSHVFRALRFAKPDYVPDEVFRDYSKHSWKSLARTFDGVLLGLPAMPLARRLNEVPILNLTASQDSEVSRRTIPQPNAKNVTLPGGHLLLLEHPVETFDIIAQFLQRES